MKANLSKVEILDGLWLPYATLSRCLQCPLLTTTRIVKDALHALIGTAEVAELSPPHRATACIALCGIFEPCQVSKFEIVRNVIWEEQIWSRLFGIYLDFFDKSKAKSMRQLLVVFTGVLKRENTPRSLQFRDQAVLRAVNLISRYQNHRKVKPALQALAHFISKDLVSIDQLIDLSSGSDVNSNRRPLRAELGQNLLAKFLDWVLHNDTALAAGHLVAHFIAKTQKFTSFKDGPRTDLPLWVKPFENSVRASPESIQEFRHHVFPEVFRLSFDDYIFFLNHLRLYRCLGQTSSIVAEDKDATNSRSDDPVETSILFAALQVGRDIGMVKDVDHAKLKTIEVRAGVLLVPDVVFGRLLSHLDPEARLAGISLLASSATITKPITKGSLQCLQDNMLHLHADTDANFRGELLSQIQRLFDRLRSSTATLSKALAGNTAALKSLSSKSSDGSRKSETNKDELHVILKYHINFISWYISFIDSELRPTASYQRHITALKSLNIVIRSGLDPSVSHTSLAKQAQGDKKWHHQRKIYTPELTRSLLDLLLDPFDEVHSVAASILRLSDNHTPSPLRPNEMSQAKSMELLRFIERAEKIMLRTGRADHADGVARAYELLYSQSDDSGFIHSITGEHEEWWLSKWTIIIHLTEQLEQTVKIARHNLSVAVNQYPVHGILASIRFIVERADFYSILEAAPRKSLEAWRNLHSRLYMAFHDVWNCVQNVLCNDAPEGHVPDDMEADSQTTTKDILSYSWRALKEASLLLRAIVSKAPFETVSSLSILDNFQLKRLGTLCFTQLINLRHRGACSAVAQTFAVCCQRCSKIGNEATQGLLLSWYQDTMLYIRDESLIITRRSAGIPFLITGIISADSESALFKHVVEDLFSEASLDVGLSKFDESRIPQVHALNCIKDIYTTTKLSSASEVYLSKGLDLAATKLGSEFWPIRNCGLMLFKALIERLLGTGDTQNWKEKRFTRTSRLSYDRFPNLLDIVVRLMTLGEPSRDAIEASFSISSRKTDQAMEAVFPALQILQQAPPPSAKEDDIRLLVLELTKAPYWYIRDMAARTWVSGLRSHDFLDKIQALLAQTSIGQHAIHGKLLCLRYGLKARSMPTLIKSYSKRVDSILEEVLNHFNDLYEDILNPLIRSAYLDVINEFSKAFFRARHTSKHLATLNSIAGHLQQDYRSSMRYLTTGFQSSLVAGSALLRKSVSLYLIFQQLFKWEMSERPPSNVEDKYTAFETLLRDLSRFDPDNYCVLLEELVELIDRAKSHSLAFSKPQIVACFNSISLDAMDPEGKAASRTAIASLFSDQAVRSSFFKTADNQTISQTIEDLEKSSLRGPPMECEASLPLYGYFLDHKARVSPEWDLDVIQEMERYARTISRGLDESNPFDIRFAAARSLAGLQHIWTTPKSPQLLRLAFLVYDALNDDDDDIREVAASVAARVLAGPDYISNSRDVVPLLASQRLAEHFAIVYTGYSLLHEEAIRRFMGTAVGQGPFEQPFPTALVEARKENSALFAQEKQNLFIDESREIAIWAAVSGRLPFEPGPNNGLLEEFEHWIIEGVNTLTTTTVEEEDGALGWASKPEVFTLGLRVVYGAKVILSWARRSSQALKAGDARRSTFLIKIDNLLKLLRVWGDAGRKREAHGLWLEQIEEAMQVTLEERLA
ncbi:uncharacterized protein BDZ99DRAFT_546992 [Mytilinidion resinicola]|uniref:DUF2428 domain-containing protein n=1 Tax=Mytilinidion resinicola TaxID=574789 RepID=A0A6A6Y4S6_9PEZI|nr:uncharacterized protein BDZ99DRAFT_546992 [Mytilinidion resinicola]KAF2803660.1 hypothetical protein BDZ99DRAFT_546992 [Mytilinidion resinicola]